MPNFRLILHVRNIKLTNDIKKTTKEPRHHSTITKLLFCRWSWKIPQAVQQKQNFFLLLLGYVIFVLLCIESLCVYLLVYLCCFEVCPNCKWILRGSFCIEPQVHHFHFCEQFFLQCSTNEILLAGGLLVPSFWWMVHCSWKQPQVGNQYLKGSDLGPTLNHCFLSWVNFQLEECCCFGSIFFFKKINKGFVWFL